mmetsp:Transcript_57681/g.172102  ORF Transcript_57681/g.172102 Transcript_57681/m.172102 type:complete len:400 (-) Transcript_57681:293-1492(-)
MDSCQLWTSSHHRRCSPEHSLRSLPAAGGQKPTQGPLHDRLEVPLPVSQQQLDVPGRHARQSVQRVAPGPLHGDAPRETCHGGQHGPERPVPSRRGLIRRVLDADRREGGAPRRLSLLVVPKGTHGPYDGRYPPRRGGDDAVVRVAGAVGEGGEFGAGRRGRAVAAGVRNVAARTRAAAAAAALGALRLMSGGGFGLAVHGGDDLPYHGGAAPLHEGEGGVGPGEVSHRVEEERRRGRSPHARHGRVGESAGRRGRILSGGEGPGGPSPLEGGAAFAIIRAAVVAIVARRRFRSCSSFAARSRQTEQIPVAFAGVSSRAAIGSGRRTRKRSAHRVKGRRCLGGASHGRRRSECSFNCVNYCFVSMKFSATKGRAQASKFECVGCRLEFKTTETIHSFEL